MTKTAPEVEKVHGETKNGVKGHANGKKRVWGCLLTNIGYLRGVLTLYYSLIRSGTTYPFYVFYTEVTRPLREFYANRETLEQKALDILAERKIPICHIPLLKPATSYSVTESRFNETWSKINIFALDQFDRIAVLDGDMLVLKNMDELMDIPIPEDGLAACHACVCNPRKLSYYPSTWIPEACAYTYQSYPSSVKEGMSASFPNGLSELNGGLQIFKPSRQKFDRIYKVLNNSSPSEFL